MWTLLSWESFLYLFVSLCGCQQVPIPGVASMIQAPVWGGARHGGLDGKAGSHGGLSLARGPVAVTVAGLKTDGRRLVSYKCEISLIVRISSGIEDFVRVTSYCTESFRQMDFNPFVIFAAMFFFFNKTDFVKLDRILFGMDCAVSLPRSSQKVKNIAFSGHLWDTPL